MARSTRAGLVRSGVALTVSSGRRPRHVSVEVARGPVPVPDR
jgi:hypothetical protein